MWAIVIVIIILLASLTISSSYHTFGQQSHTQLFKDKFTQTVTVPLPTDRPVPPNIKPLEYNLSYAEVIYESPTTIVFRGDLIIVPPEMGSSPILNMRIWEALDLLKKDGFHVIEILTTGQGSEGNPHTLYVAMEK